jgi:hypothetical protein
MLATFRLVGLVEDEIVIHSPVAKGDFLIGYNLNHEELYNININESIGQDDIVFRDIVPSTSGPQAIFFDRNLKDNSWMVAVAPFDNGKFGPLTEKFAKTYSNSLDHYYPNTGSSTYNGKGSGAFAGGFQEKAISSNKSHIAFISRIKASSRDENLQLAIIVMDHDFNLVWDRIFSFPVPADQIEIKDFLVADDGDIYFLLGEERNWEDKEWGKKAYLNWTHSILHIQPDADNRMPVKLDADLFPDAMALFLPPNQPGQVIVAGIYSTETEQKRLEGVFLIQGQDDSPTLSPRLFSFQDSLLSFLNTKNEYKMGKGLSGSFVMDGLTVFQNGNFALIAERRFVSYLSHSSSTTTYYYSNEILLPVFSKECDLISMTVIDKVFRTNGYGAHSYTSAVFEDKLHFIFPDYKTKEEREALEEQGKAFGYYTDMAIVDSMGREISRQTLFTSKDYELVFIPGLSDFFGSHFLLGTMSMNKYSFGILDLK